MVATRELDRTADARKARRIGDCPGCSGKLHYETAFASGVFECKACGAIWGQCYLGKSYEIVLPYMVTEEPAAEQTRYFDLDCLGSEGVTRRHGWFDTETRRIVQTG